MEGQTSLLGKRQRAAPAEHIPGSDPVLNCLKPCGWPNKCREHEEVLDGVPGLSCRKSTFSADIQVDTSQAWCDTSTGIKSLPSCLAIFANIGQKLGAGRSVLMGRPSMTPAVRMC